MNDKNSALHDELIAGLKRMGLAGDGVVTLTPLTGGVTWRDVRRLRSSARWRNCGWRRTGGRQRNGTVSNMPG